MRLKSAICRHSPGFIISAKLTLCHRRARLNNACPKRLYINHSDVQQRPDNKQVKKRKKSAKENTTITTLTGSWSKLILILNLLYSPPPPKADEKRDSRQAIQVQIISIFKKPFNRPSILDYNIPSKSTKLSNFKVFFNVLILVITNTNRFIYTYTHI